jgi:DNA-binding CsgD family transcriptional regulator
MGTRRAGDVQALTGRERDVAQLMARGCTNAEIAERLGITFNTAKWHVSQVIAKLEVTTREEAVTAWRAEHSTGRRIHRAFTALSVGGLAKTALATGGAALVAGGLAVIAVVVSLQGDDPEHSPAADVPLVLQVATPTPTATPTPNVPAGCPGYPGDAPLPLDPCPPEHFPAFADANATGACDLSGRQVRAVQAQNINLRNCNLAGIGLASAHMHQAHFDASDLTGADLHGGSYGSASFRGANLTGSDMRAVFQNADFREASLAGATTIGGHFGGSIWSNTICPDGSNSDDPVNGWTCAGTGGIVVAPYWAGGSSREARTPWASSDLTALDQGGCNFDGLDLRGIDLVRLNLGKCSFAGANLAGVTIRGTSLGGADLRGANIEGTRFLSVDLTAANLAGATGTPVLEFVTWDGTVCPDGSATGELWYGVDEACEGLTAPGP